MPARYAFERGAWQEAAKLQPLGSTYPFVEAITYFARASARARSGDLAAAARMPSSSKPCTRRCLPRRTPTGPPRSRSSDWPRPDGSRWAKGKSDEALKFMRAAADLEDRNEKHIVTPGRIVPARELLGEMLLEAEAARGGAQGVRSVAAARAQPLPQLPRRRARRGNGGRPREGRRLLREARGAREGATPRGPNWRTRSSLAQR